MVYNYQKRVMKDFDKRHGWEFHTVKQVAAKLNVHWQSVHNYIKRGELEAFKVGNGYRISNDAIEAFLENRKVKSGSSK